MTTATLAKTTVIQEKRSIGLGIFFLVVAVAIFALFALNTEADQTTSFGLNPGARTNAPQLEEWVVPTQTTLWILSVLVAFVGGWQLAKGFKRSNLALFGVAMIRKNSR